MLGFLGPCQGTVFWTGEIQALNSILGELYPVSAFLREAAQAPSVGLVLALRFPGVGHLAGSFLSPCSPLVSSVFQ